MKPNEKEAINWHLADKLVRSFYVDTDGDTTITEHDQSYLLNMIEKALDLKESQAETQWKSAMDALDNERLRQIAEADKAYRGMKEIAAEHAVDVIELRKKLSLAVMTLEKIVDREEKGLGIEQVHHAFREAQAISSKTLALLNPLTH